MDTPSRRAPDEDAADHAAGHWTPRQHHEGACHQPSTKSDVAAEAVVLSPRPAPSCPSSASLSFFLCLWKGNVCADEGDVWENMPSLLRGSSEMSDASDPVRFFRHGVKQIWCRMLSPQTRLDVSPICSSPGAILSAIHAAADACHHHNGNRRGKSAGCGHVGRRFADQRLRGSELD